MNLFHQSHGHLHEDLLRETAKQLGVTLMGKLHECKGYSLAKELRKLIPTSTTTRAAKPLGVRSWMRLAQRWSRVQVAWSTTLFSSGMISPGKSGCISGNISLTPRGHLNNTWLV
ncbi:unnamed protein product [Sphacelaria rigidula]